MFRGTGRLTIVLACYAALPAAGQTVTWNSDANATNLTSGGLPMDSGFRFELGVFSGSFVPTTANKADWAAHWNAAKRTSYDATHKRYASTHTPGDNDGPFDIGKPAYMWGFRGDAASGEWILFRAASWIWPDANPPAPLAPIQWFAADATPVLGSINYLGIPFLMRSAAVTNAAPPATTWTQWKAEFLAGEPLNGKDDDPDHDGTSNLLEFVFGTPPTSAGAPVATPVELAGGHLQITVPRRIDHVAVLTVEVSSDLTNWHSGPAHTEVVDDGIAALVVRDLTAPDASHPQRFMRLSASIP
jgi:hypothetical protein